MKFILIKFTVFEGDTEYDIFKLAIKKIDNIDPHSFAIEVGTDLWEDDNVEYDFEEKCLWFFTQQRKVLVTFIKEITSAEYEFLNNMLFNDDSIQE